MCCVLPFRRKKSEWHYGRFLGAHKGGRTVGASGPWRKDWLVRDHVVLCGSDVLAVRVLDELTDLGVEAVVISQRPDRRLEARVRELGVPTVEGDYRDEETLRAAGVADAEAVAVLDEDDVGNVHAALAAQELNDDVRLVVRMFNLDLGRRLEALFHDGEVLSASALAAPAFAHAALQGNVAMPVRVRDRLLEVRPAQSPGERRLAVDVAEAPYAPETGTDAMVRQATSWARRIRARFRALMRLFDARLAALLGALAVVVAIAAEVFHNANDLSWLNALYFTVTTVTTTGYGDINLLDAPDGVKLFGMGLMLLGGLVVAVLFALVTDAIVTARIARTLGELPRPRSGHAVVCGLGRVGFRIVQRLVAAGVPCIAVERREDNPFLDATRRMGVPVLVDDASRRETLAPLRLHHARAVLAVTDDDLANLETALNARTLNPSIRVVMRLFSHDLAERSERTFSIAISRSVSALAAPAVVAAIVRRRVVATVPLGSRALAVADLPGTALAGRTIDEAEAALELRVLARDEAWWPPGSERIDPQSRLLVLASREGLAAVHFGAG
jgi:Trk K+ transport system NAD-binding subunit